MAASGAKRIFGRIAVNDIFPFIRQAISLTFHNSACQNAFFDVRYTEAIGFHLLLGVNGQDILTISNHISHFVEGAIKHFLVSYVDA